MCSYCCLLVLRLGRAKSPPAAHLKPIYLTCYRLLASLLQTSVRYCLAPCFLVVSFLSSPGLFGYLFLFIFPWSCVSPPSSLCSTTTATNSNPELCLAHSISNPLLCFHACVVCPVTSFQSITLKTSFHEIIDQALCNIALVSGKKKKKKKETRRKDFWSVKANCTRHISEKVHVRLLLMRLGSSEILSINSGNQRWR